MDSWPQEHQRHKVTFPGHMEPLNLTNSIYSTQRAFGEMSQHATLSPSPFIFGHPAPSSAENVSFSPPPFFDRRRQSHPHTPPARPNSTFSPGLMAEHLRPSQRPSLGHRASQTIIDLTDEADDGDLYLLNPRSVQRPPRLGRSDSSALGDFIDLTGDNGEDDLEITHTRTIPGAPSAPNALHEHRRRRVQPEIFPRDNSPFFMQHAPRDPPRNTDRDILSRPPFASFGGIRALRGFQPWAHEGHEHIVFVPAPQRMPDLHYEQHPFAQARHADIPQNPPLYEPPPAAREGFTRSPTEDDIVICPACEQELVARNDEDQTAVKKTKTQNKRDRAEHPFWVVKACGHVYCNQCFQNRKGDKKQPSPFPDTGKVKHSRRAVECAVEDCHQEAGDKKYWVGVFI